ncbi:uncharacterized protein DDB_G0283357 isoform X2 [Folsomia candida]|uniref:uncharacterized protein DDB_G0283357 isoform X2 n=1 Tax=Folsomia candida TaxID=158441 RepID=UPI000B8F4236|nr:uncharacterized protein DDB_G0283357 isoform X2 [Folsomia candida]XP_021965371.1 uncharacterized protein DDB_G0283357 isoform X2 [Folsomia candida]XP_035716339.1 uncharacterized protein DDB_G0283357 isoform X2 [Folsomia candida]
MATHRELTIDWNMLDNDCNNWTLQDLQLAAELGRTLLERNEELETELKQQQVVIDDQAQEIEFLTKQSISMKEESANRSKIYENLESSICELEKTNSQLSRKHEVDKKRIQSLGENIEYLERKCDELNVTLQSLKNDQGKKSGGSAGGGGGGKLNRNSYFSFGSDSSEEEMSSGFGLFRKRSHSLQDLRDYTPSPDEFDSGNSNSPDLKTSESEFIDSLENRIEELIASRNKENEKVRQLEAQIHILVQENEHLQQQIVQISNEKDEEVTELRKILRDSSIYGSQSNLNSAFSTPLTSTRRNSETNSTPGRGDHINPSGDLPANNNVTNSTGIGSTVLSSFNRTSSSNSSICKRCAAEIQVLSLVNSIENDGNLLYDWDFANPDDDMEFSSLEHELAKATGTPYRRDNRFSEEFKFSNGMIHPSSPSSNSQTAPNSRRTSFEPIHKNGNEAIFNSHRKMMVDNAKLIHGYSGHMDVDEMDYDSTEISNIFFGDNRHSSLTPTRAHSPTKVRFSNNFDVLDGSHNNNINNNNHQDGEISPSSGSITSGDEMGSCDDDERMDEDPCLIKDRKPEFAKNKNKSSKSKRAYGPWGSEVLSSNPKSSDGTNNNILLSGSTSSVKKNPKFLELPKRIPTDDEESDNEDAVHNCHEKIGVKSSAEGCLPTMGSMDVTDELDLTEKIIEEEPSSLLLCQNPNFDEDDTISECSEASETGTLSTSSAGSATSSSSNSSSSIVSTSSSPPEYKQILTSLFSIFNNSKRKYPIPMYPFIQEARRQSGGLIHHHSSGRNH